MPGPTIPTPEQIAYMQEHASDNIVPNLIACSTICPILATIFIGFRLWSRRINHGRLKLDASDYLSIAAWVCFQSIQVELGPETDEEQILYIPYNVVIGLITRYGAGRHIIFVTNPRMLQIVSISYHLAHRPRTGGGKINIVFLSCWNLTTNHVNRE